MEAAAVSTEDVEVAGSVRRQATGPDKIHRGGRPVSHFSGAVEGVDSPTGGRLRRGGRGKKPGA